MNRGVRLIWLAGAAASFSLLACTSPPAAPAGSRSAPLGSDEPALSKAVATPSQPLRGAPSPREPAKKPPPELDEPWSWVLPVDHGIRRDDGGKGTFLAPRGHGRHNGIDLLAPLGTPVQAPCNGKARAGASSSFGRWVQVVCRLPAELNPRRTMHASIFYSHLSQVRPKADFERVRRSEAIGAVGKSGNAAGSQIAPHLHLEIVVHDGEQAALEERHSGRDQSKSLAAELFLGELSRVCLEPNKFGARAADHGRARRIDPFVVLTCVSPDKPALSLPRQPLADAHERWSEHYTATGFDVDVGRRISGR
jgi:murein DD-endopeptidase MepM/ murein hydrolase activator NlpD